MGCHLLDFATSVCPKGSQHNPDPFCPQGVHRNPYHWMFFPDHTILSILSFNSSPLSKDSYTVKRIYHFHNIIASTVARENPTRMAVLGILVMASLAPMTICIVVFFSYPPRNVRIHWHLGVTSCRYVPTHPDNVQSVPLTHFSQRE